MAKARDPLATPAGRAVVAALKKQGVYVKKCWRSTSLNKWIYVVKGGPFLFERQRAGYDGLWAMEREAAAENERGKK